MPHGNISSIGSRFRLFMPILPGAKLSDRVLACLGALLGISATGIVSGWAASAPNGLLLMGPIGASAVLVFAVPSSPLAQPWPLIGGSILSAIIGFLISQVMLAPAISAGLAVAAAILAMSFLRCLHPPGGAAAMLAALGGSATGLMDSVVPAVALNAMLLGVAGWLYHRFSGHSYPHRAAAVAPSQSHGLMREDIDWAIDEIGETFDIDRDDLEALLQLAEGHAIRRASSVPVSKGR